MKLIAVESSNPRRLHARVYCKAVHTKHPKHSKTRSQRLFTLQRKVTSSTFGDFRHQQTPTCSVLAHMRAKWHHVAPPWHP